MEKIAKYLKTARIEKGYSQQEIADLLNISRQSISNWENGKSYPDLENLILLSNICEFSLDSLKKANPRQKIKSQDFYKSQLELIEQLKRNLQNLMSA